MIKTVSKSPAAKVAPLQERYGPIVREHESWSAGDVAHQGDVIFVCLACLPQTAKKRKNRQLADGETQGSRHVLDGGDCYAADAVELCQMIAAATKGKLRPTETYIGPVFTGAALVRHPEHQDQGFPADTVTACVYQRNLDAEGREVRARD